MEVIRPSETSVLTRATRRHITEEVILVSFSLFLLSAFHRILTYLISTSVSYSLLDYFSFNLCLLRTSPHISHNRVAMYLEVATPLYFSVGLEWDRVHYYCGHLLAYCTSTG
jgi:hypothetical protein